VARGFLTALLFLCCAVGLRSETYADWMRAVPNQSATPFTDWIAPEVVGSNVNDEGHSLFSAPGSSLFGHVDLSSLPPAEFPLKVRFYYRHLDPAAVISDQNGSHLQVPHWTSPLGLLAPGGPLGELIESREFGLATPAESTAVPVWAITFSNNMGRGMQLGNAYSVLLEVAGRDGTLLVRRRLIEGVYESGRSNVMLARNDSDGESHLKPLGYILGANNLPVEPAFYADVKVLWLDDVTLHDSRFSDDFWRQILIGGTSIVGHDVPVAELARRLGIDPHQRVLQGGLWSIDAPGFDLAEQMKSSFDGRYYLKLGTDENPFRNPFDFARKRDNQLRNFSIGFLLIFVLFESIVIISSFSILSGPRRVLRWLLVPFSAIVYTVLGFVVVHFVVDFRPDVQVIREIDSVEGWPESLVQSNITRLGFEDAAATLTAPAQAGFNGSEFDGESAPHTMVQQDDKTTFSVRQHYGRFANFSIRYRVQNESPMKLTAFREIISTNDLSGAWVWDGKVWRNLGPLRAGEAVSIERAKIVIDPATISINQQPMVQNGSWQPQEFLLPVVSQMCTANYMKSLRGTNVGILLAVEDQPVAEQFADAATSETHVQTLLVYQFTYPAPLP
jgi:hypothetical protein